MSLEKKVVLFGRAGDGKSTVGNALVTGDIEPVVFQSSEEEREFGAEIQQGTGRGWKVTDMVGIGEEGESGTTAEAEAKAILAQFLPKVEDSYSHIIFVQRANKETPVDEMNWLLFTSIFEGAEDAFVILFTAADEKWLEDNRHKLPNYMKGIDMLVVDIPPASNLSLPESMPKEVVERSIKKLEEDLAALLNRRENKYCTPLIARMNGTELSGGKVVVVDAVFRRIYDPGVCWM